MRSSLAALAKWSYPSHEKPSGFFGKVAPERWITTLAAKWPARTPSGRSLPAKSWLKKPARKHLRSRQANVLSDAIHKNPHDLRSPVQRKFLGLPSACNWQLAGLGC